MKKRLYALVLVMALIMSIVFNDNTVMAATSKPVLSASKIVLVVDKIQHLQVANATALPKWTSSDEAIASVSSHGTVTAEKAGKCTINCKIGKTVLKCSVTVKSVPSSKTIMKNTSVSYKLLNNGTVKCTVTNKLPYTMRFRTKYTCYDSNGTRLDTEYGIPIETDVYFSALTQSDYCFATINANSTMTYYTLPKTGTAYIEKADSKFEVYCNNYDNYILDNSYTDYEIMNETIDDDNIHIDFDIKNNGNFSILIPSLRLTLYDENNNVYRIVTMAISGLNNGIISPGKTRHITFWISSYFTHDELQKYKLEVKPLSVFIYTPNND